LTGVLEPCGKDEVAAGVPDEVVFEEPDDPFDDGEKEDDDEKPHNPDPFKLKVG
jgi:hypothetical protein